MVPESNRIGHLKVQEWIDRLTSDHQQLVTVRVHPVTQTDRFSKHSGQLAEK